MSEIINKYFNASEARREALEKGSEFFARKTFARIFEELEVGSINSGNRDVRFLSRHFIVPLDSPVIVKTGSGEIVRFSEAIFTAAFGTKLEVLLAGAPRESLEKSVFLGTFEIVYPPEFGPDQKTPRLIFKAGRNFLDGHPAVKLALNNLATQLASSYDPAKLQIDDVHGMVSQISGLQNEAGQSREISTESKRLDKSMIIGSLSEVFATVGRYFDDYEYESVKKKSIEELELRAKLRPLLEV